jgi:hypothetical protein
MEPTWTSGGRYPGGRRAEKLKFYVLGKAGGDIEVA